MIKRLLPLAAVLAAAGAIALAGVAQGSGTNRHHKAVHRSLVAHRHHSARAAETSAAVDGDNVQSGDQTTPDTESATTGEQSGSEQANDGPGGHEDQPGAEVDHQFEGEG
jgi:hypothetical protein